MDEDAMDEDATDEDATDEDAADEDVMDEDARCARCARSGLVWFNSLLNLV